jgi:hypothetical protein
MTRLRKKVIPKKKRGRPATGRDPVTALRLPRELRDQIDTWANGQDDRPGRSEAIRRLVEIALGSAERANVARDKAASMAALTVDALSDRSAPPEVQSERKRRLVKGPKELRDLQVPKRKRKGSAAHRAREEG